MLAPVAVAVGDAVTVAVEVAVEVAELARIRAHPRVPERPTTTVRETAIRQVAVVAAPLTEAVGAESLSHRASRRQMARQRVKSAS